MFNSIDTDRDGVLGKDDLTCCEGMEDCMGKGMDQGMGQGKGTGTNQ